MYNLMHISMITEFFRSLVFIVLDIIGWIARKLNKGR